jgi:hypothetical protein
MERNKKNFWDRQKQTSQEDLEHFRKTRGVLDFRKILRQNTAPLGGHNALDFIALKKCNTGLVLSGILRICEMEVKKLFISLVTTVFEKDISHLLRQKSNNEIAHYCYVNKT